MPVPAASSAKTVAAISPGPALSASWSRATPRTTLAIGSKAMLVAIAGARAPVSRDSWFNVIDAYPIAASP